jgi:PadR family transcriptional regulator, regulatory protein PadR
VAFSRDLLRGSLEMLVLSELGSGSRYGYQILVDLRHKSGGRVDLKAGTLYPILHKLERTGCIRSWWDESAGRDRKWYALTDKGQSRVHCDAREWLDYATCVRAMLGPILGGDVPPVETAAG